ncbi:MAG: hypothetical protein K0M70_13445 [Arenimonas sp.]|uniref:hypothetical protein n=1 Tax=Arenimonas sp. TaxID=1872635 RepID=UPI0025BA5F22|nr:hypothetical protein [Arenimonas sp.]MBW8368849.1 hypothetical protein [Arenimonas sp.]
MRTWLVISIAAALAGCGGGGEAVGGTPNELAAKACEDDTKSRLGGKLYELDVSALAASMRDAPNGEKFLTAPIVIEPGLTSEVKQIVECTVRFTEGKPTPDVVGFVFNW